MTLFFNLDNLEKESCNDPVKFIKIFEIFLYKKLPTRTASIPRLKLNLNGTSYLLNPTALTEAKKTVDIAYIVQYIKLAARRDYGLYKHHGIKSLQISYFPDLNMQAIRTNPLLKITQTEIFFLYEEKLKETKWH